MPSLLIVIRSYRDGDRDDVVALWEDCGLLRPWNDPDKDIRRKQAVQSHLFLVAELDDRIVGSAMAGYDGHRGWVNYLATHPAHQHQGIATMDDGSGRERTRGDGMSQDQHPDPCG